MNIVEYCTFAFPHFDGKDLSSIGVDEEFPQDTQRVDKDYIFKLFSCINAPLGWTWNIYRK